MRLTLTCFRVVAVVFATVLFAPLVLTQFIHPTREEQIKSHAVPFRCLEGGPSYDKITPDGKGEIDLSRDVILDYARLPPQTPEAEIAAMSELSDVVIVGQPTTSESYLTPSKSFLFTEWGVICRRIVKNRPSQPLVIGQAYTILQPGGSLKLNDLTLIARNPLHEPLSANQRYLFFLNTQGDTNTFTVHSSGLFRLAGTRVVHLTPPQAQSAVSEFASSHSENEFLKLVQQSAR